MKRFLLCTLILLSFSPALTGQCCPYVNDVFLFPDNPSNQDSIYLLTDITTPGVGNYLGYEVAEGNQEITVAACYNNGTLPLPVAFLDTINLGVKEDGQYELTFIAYSSFHPDSCTKSDTTYVELSFEVGTVNATNNLSSSQGIEVFPNPITGEYLNVTSKDDWDRVKLIDLNGIEILNRRVNGTVKTNSLALTGVKPGVYFLIITLKNGQQRSCRIMKL